MYLKVPDYCLGCNLWLKNRAKERMETKICCEEFGELIIKSYKSISYCPFCGKKTKLLF